MEEDLFKYSRRYTVDTLIFYFYDIELLTEIWEFPVGTKFESARIDYGKGKKVTFYSSDVNGKTEAIYCFGLVLSINPINNI